jgi:hypothetical protein
LALTRHRTAFVRGTEPGQSAWLDHVNNRRHPMAKTQNSKKQTKKAPLKTAAQKRQAKQAKKSRG